MRLNWTSYAIIGLVIGQTATAGAQPAVRPTPPTTPDAGADKPSGTSRRLKRVQDAAAKAIKAKMAAKTPKTGAVSAAAPPAAPPATLPATPPAPTAAPVVSGSGVMEVPGEKEFNTCLKVGNRRVKMNFKPDTEIADVVNWFSAITCAPFLIPSTVSLQGKKVTIISPEPVTASEAYRLFYSSLDSLGLTVVPSGRFLRITETTRARFGNLPVYADGERAARAGGFITKLIKVDYVDTSELINGVLNHLKSEPGHILPFRNSIIITDQSESVEKLSWLIKEFDVPPIARDRIWMVRIKNMSATEMASRVAEILPVLQVGTGAGARRTGGAPPVASPPSGVQKASAPPGATDLAAEMTITKLVPEERSNSLMVIANERAYEWLMTIIRKLDQPIDGGTGSGDGKVHVYYCENANCDELAATLSAIAGVSVVGGGGAARRTTRTSTPGAPMPTPMPAGAQQGQQQPLLFEGEVRITFDAPTNALIVVSSFKDFQALRRVIEKLDGPRKQIFIEATIMEVLIDKSRDVGVAYHGGKGVDIAGQQSLLLGGFNANKTINPLALVGDLGGLTGALFGPTLPAQTTRIFGASIEIPSFGVFLKLLQTNNDVNVLSNPSLLITNNQEGEISVGENLPFPAQLLGGFGGLPGASGAAAGGLGSFLPSVGVQRQDVALKMKIIPSVNEHNMIRLEVDQEISDVSSPNFNGLGPATSKRAAKTTVTARDQQTVVIGGLMTDRVSEEVQKIPILGDIPVLGFFFRSTKKTMKKSNILIALTPYVINDVADLRRVAEKKMRERREFIERYSSFEDMASLDKNLDYSRSRGMLEEINRTAKQVEDEEAELRRLRERDEREEAMPIEPPSGRRPPLPTVVPAPAPLPAAPPAPTAPPPPTGPAPPPTPGVTPTIR